MDQEEAIARDFLEFCRSQPDGGTDKEFRVKFPDYSPVDLAMAINHLSTKGMVALFKTAQGSLVYKAIGMEDADIVSRLEGDERIVYQCIKAADNKGIWTKDMKTRTGLHQTVITKVLKSLEGRKLIKAVKGVKNSTRKVYMLAGVEPSKDLTGGPWFSENELDVEFIEELCKVCLRYVTSKSVSQKPGHIFPSDHSGLPTLGQIHNFLMESRVTSAELGTADISMLMDRLIYDGLVEKHMWTGASRVSRIVDDDEDEDDDGLYVYRAIKPALPKSILASLPCGHCPVFDSCSDFGPIQPSTCSYYNDWLSF